MLNNKNPNIVLSTSEIATLWTTYMNDSMAVCVLKHALQHITDPDIKRDIQFALHLSESHVIEITRIFKEAEAAIPDGFNTQDDVNLSAPQLFSDSFYLLYVNNMAKIGGNSYTLALANSARKDIRNFFTKLTEETIKLYNQTAETLLTKGLFIRPPQIGLPQTVDYVHKQGFLSGWLGERRPVTAIEIMNLFFNIQRNETGRSLLTGFSQTSKNRDVVDYLKRGIDISNKQIEVYSSVLSEDDVSAPMTWDSIVTRSTTPTFSDKLIMFHTAALVGASLGHMGTSLGTSPRRDIGLHYNRLMQEITAYGEDGANILIANGWMEQPPTSIDRDALRIK